MSKYRYKQYINRAFWNSLFAVLSALVFVLILVYGWRGLQAVMERINIGGGGEEPGAEEQSRLQLLESLRGTDDVPEAEKERILNELRADDSAELSEAEKLKILESLRQVE